MTTREHIARAEHLLAGVVAETRIEGIALAIGHALVGWVRHETGYGMEEAAEDQPIDQRCRCLWSWPSDANQPHRAERHPLCPIHTEGNV